MKSVRREVRYSRVVRAHDQADAKRRLKPGVLVLVVPNSRPKSLKFLCPCGCGETVSVNLMPGNERAWRLQHERKYGISLWPSVWLSSGCCSHFILRRNNAHLLSARLAKGSTTDSKDWYI
jgi:Family of unknown function (DUF6527)